MYKVVKPHPEIEELYTSVYAAEEYEKSYVLGTETLDTNGLFVFADLEDARFYAVPGELILECECENEITLPNFKEVNRGVYGWGTRGNTRHFPGSKAFKSVKPLRVVHENP